MSIECISWLIKVTYNNDARWKPVIKVKPLLVSRQQYVISRSTLTFLSLSDFSGLKIPLYLDISTIQADATTLPRNVENGLPTDAA